MLNVYAPTIDKVTEQANFGHLLSNAMENFFGHSVILGGDLNFNLENLKTFQKSQSHSYSRYLLHLLETHDLVDIWNLKYPDVYRFTRRENTRYGPVQSRIDYFLVTSHLEYVIETADIQPGLKSDYSLLKITILLENQPKRGRGLWKLNTSLLQDDNYIKFIKSTIQEGRLDIPNLNVKHVAWDYIKCRIRTESISFSIKRNKKQRDYINTLSGRLVHLEERLTTSPSLLEVEEYESIKSEIEHYYEEKAKGTLICSRCKSINEYEKPSKYFLNLEKVRQEKLHIRALNIDGQRISNPSQILEAPKVFYDKLFSCSETDFNMTEGECNNYLDNVLTPKLSNRTKDVCDGVITMTELEKAVQELKNNKAPGPDGLPGQFYKIFWSDISAFGKLSWCI